MNPEKIVTMNNSINAVVQELLNEIAEMKRKISELEQNKQDQRTDTELNEQQIDTIVDSVLDSIDYSEISQRIVVRDVVRHLDYSEIAANLDTNEVAQCLDTYEIASSVSENIDIENVVDEAIKNEMPDMDDAVAEALKEHIESLGVEEIKAHILDGLVESFFGGYASMQMKVLKAEKAKLDEVKEVTA